MKRKPRATRLIWIGLGCTIFELSFNLNGVNLIKYLYITAIISLNQYRNCKYHFIVRCVSNIHVGPMQVAELENHGYIIIIIIIIIKTSSTGPSGKNKTVYKLLTQPHKHLRHGKFKSKLREATKDWLLP